MTGTRSGWCWQTIKKQDDNLQFVIEKTDDLDTLFGNNHGLRHHDQAINSLRTQRFRSRDLEYSTGLSFNLSAQQTPLDEQAVNHG